MTNKLYIQRYILLKLLSEELKTGDVIPSEFILGQKFSCTRLTARSALINFVSLGLLKPIKGKGYEIVGDPKVILFSSIIHNDYWDDVNVDFFNKEKISNFIKTVKETLKLEVVLNNCEIVKFTFKNKEKIIGVQISIINKEKLSIINKKTLDNSIAKVFAFNGVLPNKIITTALFSDVKKLDNDFENLGYKDDVMVVYNQFTTNDELLAVSIQAVHKNNFVAKIKKTIL